MPSKTKYPYFDSLELLLENDFTFKPFKALSPVRTGNIVPGFAFSRDLGRWVQYVNGGEAGGYVPSRKLAYKPVVVAFYSGNWGQHGINQLLRLNALNKLVNATGGELIVVCPEREASLNKLGWDHNLSLTFYFDYNNTLARQFRIYDEASPVWNLFSGIDENAPLLATYVLSPQKNIIYHHIDFELSGDFPAEGILAALSETTLYSSERKSA